MMGEATLDTKSRIKIEQKENPHVQNHFLNELLKNKRKVKVLVIA